MGCLNHQQHGTYPIRCASQGLDICHRFLVPWEWSFWCQKWESQIGCFLRVGHLKWWWKVRESESLPKSNQRNSGLGWFSLVTSWWFPRFFVMFTPETGKDSHFDYYFSTGLKPPTRLLTSIKCLVSYDFLMSSFWKEGSCCWVVSGKTTHFQIIMFSAKHWHLPKKTWSKKHLKFS